MHICRLPDEVLTEIFSNLSLAFNLRKVCLVCKRWHYLCKDLLPWCFVEIGRGIFLQKKDIVTIASHSKHIRKCFLNNSLEMYSPLDSFTYVMEKFFKAPKLQELNLSYCNITSLEFLQWSPNLHTLILRCCKALSSCSVLCIDKFVTENLVLLDISYISMEEEDLYIIEQVISKLPHLMELYAYGFPISVCSVSRILDKYAFDKLQVLGATCEHGHRIWEYTNYVVGSYPCFQLQTNEFEDDISSIVPYPSGSD